MGSELFNTTKANLIGNVHDRQCKTKQKRYTFLCTLFLNAERAASVYHKAFNSHKKKQLYKCTQRHFTKPLSNLWSTNLQKTGVMTTRAVLKSCSQTTLKISGFFFRNCTKIRRVNDSL